VRSLLITDPRTRLVCCLVLAAIAVGMNAEPRSRTGAYFTSASSTAPSTIRTVSLGVTGTPSVSGVFDVASNMLPGDFAIRLFDLVNTGSAGVAQQDFTYAVTSASTGAGNQCSLLDSTDPPTCGAPAAPSSSSTTAAALLLLRCTADAAGQVPLACDTQDVYVTQVYPAAGAGTQQRLTGSGGMSRSAISGVATGSAYSIDIGGTAFTGGPLRISTPFGAGGPDSVTGADGQLRGLAADQTDHLASIVYLPTQAGESLANQASVLTFTWTATQRLGGLRS
jgi:hypothetical protein